jgi:hypothetical protein
MCKLKMFQYNSLYSKHKITWFTIIHYSTLVKYDDYSLIWRGLAHRITMNYKL